MSGTLSVPFTFNTESGNQPASQLDTNFSNIVTYVNGREVTIGLLSSRPAAGLSGRWFFASDSGQLFVDNGSIWTVVGNAVGLGDVGLAESFLGLDLRTHPDFDVAKSKMALLALRSVTMNDGFRYDNAVVPGTDVPLLADITVSGAGGLDTGSETASVWYEVYIIGKSSTKAKSDLRLLFHRAKDFFSDSGQQFTTTADATRNLRILTGTPTDKLAQGFKTPTAGAPGKIEFVDAVLIRTGAIAGNVWFEIWSDSAGSPGTLQKTSDKFDATKISTSAQTIRFPFRDPFTTADTSTQYHLVFNGDYAKSDTIFIGWRGVAAGGYANGSAKEFNGSVWGAASGVGDFNFKVFTTRNDLSVTMPFGWDQRAKLGWVFNNGGSNFDPIHFIERQAYLLSRQSLTTGFGIQPVPQLVDLSTLIPPVHVSLAVDIGNLSNGYALGIGPIPDGIGITQTMLGRVGGGSMNQNTGASSTTFQVSAPVATEFQACYLISLGIGAADVDLSWWSW